MIPDGADRRNGENLHPSRELRHLLELSGMILRATPHNTYLGNAMIMKSVLIMTNPVRNFATLPFHVKISHAVSVALYGARAPAAASAVFTAVVLPLLKPVLVTVMVLTFLNTWNEFVMPLYFLGSSVKWPMTHAVYNFFGMYATDWNLVCADIVLPACLWLRYTFWGSGSSLPA